MTPAAVLVVLALSALAAVSWRAGAASERARVRPVAARTEAAASPAPGAVRPLEPAVAGQAEDAFLATLSHELRNPLTSIVGWANLLQLGRLSPEETARALETILRNATAQGRIIDDLLDVSSPATAAHPLELSPVEAGAIVKEAVEAVTPAATAKGVGLQLVLDPAGSWIAGEPDRLRQVFSSLLGNAVKFTARNGRVRVGVRSIGTDVEVVVDDTGVGIAPGFLPRMFERFAQGDSSSTRSAPGLGLGLSIARQLAEQHGGTIHAESAGVGYGATFTAAFPRSPAPASLSARGFAGGRAPEALHSSQPEPPSELVAAVASPATRRG
jgi:signal transduction histidine kinase